MRRTSRSSGLGPRQERAVLFGAQGRQTPHSVRESRDFLISESSELAGCDPNQGDWTDCFSMQVEESEIEGAAHAADLSVLSFLEEDRELRVMFRGALNGDSAGATHSIQHRDPGKTSREARILGRQRLVEPEPVFLFQGVIGTKRHGCEISIRREKQRAGGLAVETPNGKDSRGHRLREPRQIAATPRVIHRGSDSLWLVEDQRVMAGGRAQSSPVEKNLIFREDELVECEGVARYPEAFTSDFATSERGPRFDQGKARRLTNEFVESSRQKMHEALVPYFFCPAFKRRAFSCV